MARDLSTAEVAIRWVAMASVSIIIAGHANAAGPLPPAVEADIKAEMKECATHDAKFKKGFLIRRDINGDGKEDYILDYGHFICGRASNTYCGSGGCSTTIYASTASGYVRVLNDTVRGVEFKTIHGRPAMILGLHGSACGKAGSAECGETLYWNGEKFSPAH